MLSSESTFGLGTTDQKAPLKVCTKVWIGASGPFSYEPTATHELEEMHETPVSSFSEPGFGVEVTDHEVPSKVSARV
jgi:hypothetical protein